MSMFLAPIHTWLFNKIKLAQDLEISIINEHKVRFGESVLDIQREALSLYGSYIEEKPLEDIIDLNNIHGWLQDRIREVESRSSYIITKYLEIYGEESECLTSNEYIRQAEECSNVDGNKVNSPENVYMTVNNYILSGMPCDRVNSVIQKDDECIIYKQTGCIHKDNYENGKANLEYMYRLRDLWIKTFLENLDPKYKYEVITEGNTKTSKIIKE